jgi:hypothetical protein
LVDVVDLQMKVAALTTELGDSRSAFESYKQMSDQRFQQVLHERDEARAMVRFVSESSRIATEAAAESAAAHAIAATSRLPFPAPDSDDDIDLT